MKSLGLACLFLSFVGSCLGQTQEALCPKHIEAPVYPPIARAAHVTGKVVLTVTIDADGNVSDAKPTNSAGSVRLFKDSAIDNIRHWTFPKPPVTPYTEVVTYEYEFDQSLAPASGKKNLPSVTKVAFDLPDRVTILTNLSTIVNYTSKVPR
ncbi:MAG TPA: energy transducer TonB [Candidatus Acidoferrales bacterium]|nr:energy transducer TonB [Candidatus Acidoferrales bacterium]